MAKASKGPAPKQSGRGPADLEATATVARLEERFGLEAGVLEGWGVTDRGDGRGVAILYRGADGAPLFSRRRTKVSATHNTYQPRGQALSPYGLWRGHLQLTEGYVVLVEGESDCWCLWQHGLPALGLPGAESAGCLRAEDIFSVVERVYVVLEPDDSGNTFLAGCRTYMAGHHPTIPTCTLNLGPYRDVGEMHARVGRSDFPRAWARARASAGPKWRAADAPSEPPQGPSPSEGAPGPAGVLPRNTARGINRGRAKGTQPGTRDLPRLARDAPADLAPADLDPLPEGEGPCGGSEGVAPVRGERHTRPPAPPPPTPLPGDPPSANGVAPTVPPAPLTPSEPAPYAPGNSRKPEGRRASELRSVPMEWLVQPWIPRRKIVCVTGPQGCGKSTFGAWLIKTVGRCVVLPGREEGAEEELLDRLVVAGVALDDVWIADGREWSFPTDERRLIETVREWGAQLVWIDPIASYVTEGSRNDGEYVRPALESLASVAKKTGAALVYVRHPGKDPRNLNPGAAEWSQVPRVIIELVTDPSDRARHIIRPEKASRGRSAPATYYYLDTVDDGAPTWRWGDPVAQSVVETIRDVPDMLDRRKIDRAVHFLTVALADGAMLSRDLLRLGLEEDLNGRILQRGMEAAGVEFRRAKAGKAHCCWWWIQGHGPDPSLATDDSGTERHPRLPGIAT